jgi:hypothetical protein
LKHLFFKESDASLCLKKQMKCLIISSEKMLIFFWRKHDSLDFCAAEITSTGLLR